VTKVPTLILVVTLFYGFTHTNPYDPIPTDVARALAVMCFSFFATCMLAIIALLNDIKNAGMGR
jgi:hypothetical protein